MLIYYIMCQDFLDGIDDFWNNYKYRISTKLSIVLSVSATIAGGLMAKYTLPSYILLGLVNSGVFFTTIFLQKFEHENKNLVDENKSIKEDYKRRMTVFNECSITENSSDTPQSVESVEPINFKAMHENNLSEK